VLPRHLADKAMTNFFITKQAFNHQPIDMLRARLEPEEVGTYVVVLYKAIKCAGIATFRLLLRGDYAVQRALVSAILKLDTYRRLCETPKWIFPESRPCAFAVRAIEGGVILVSNGLTQFIAFCAYHAGIAGLMAGRGLGEFNLTLFEDIFLHIVANHVEHGWPLPDTIDVSTMEAYQHICIHRDCMMTLVLLHELGHIALGHLDATPVGPIAFQPRVVDASSELHSLEIEADDFALQAFTNTDALNIAATLLTAWAYAEACRRLTRGPSAHLRLTHPLSINRLNHLARRLSERKESAPESLPGLLAIVERTAVITESPSGVGLTAEPFSHEDGLARHRKLLDEHRRYAEPFA
jgi:hypothetical protein